MKKRYYCICFVALSMLLSSCGPVVSPRYSQNSASKKKDQMPNEPGKCYAKGQMPDLYKTTLDSIPTYIGSADLENVYLEKRVQIEPDTFKWVKKKADRNCLSADPNDCLVWCKVNVPATYKTIKTISPDIPPSDVKWTVSEKVELIEKGSIEWVEVVCGKDVNKSLLISLNNALSKFGFIQLEGLETFEIETKNALRTYQLQNSLPKGNLNVTTLEHLGIY